MPERDFENKVQQVMEPFELAPDSRLFPAILDQVRRRRKRRRRLLWLWIPLLLLPAALYLAYQPGNRSAVSEKMNQVAVQEGPDTDAAGSAGVPAMPDAAAGQPEASGPAQNRQVLVSPVVPGDQQQAAAIHQTRRGISGKKQARTRVTTVLAEAEEADPQTADLPVPAAVNASGEKVVSPVVATTITPSDSVSVTALKSATEIKKDTPQTAKKEVASDKKKTKLTWLITAAAGISAMGNRYNNTDLFNSEALSGPGNSPGPSGNTFSPGRIRPGPGFMAGIGLQWPLAEKLRVQAGLQYRYQSNWLAVGDAIRAGQVQGVAADQFQSGNSHQFRNTIQSVALPVSLHFHAFTIGGHALELKAGVHVENIIHSRLLQFNPYTGTYYEDSRNLRKWLGGFQLGAAVNLAGKNKPALYLGPEYWQSFTPAADGGLFARSRARFVGLRFSREF